MRLVRIVAGGVVAVVVLTIWGAAIADTITQGTTTHEYFVGARTVAGPEPMQVCAPASEETVGLIESGQELLVLVLSEYSPSESGEHEFSITTPDGFTQHVGVYPGQGFDRDAKDLHQRFMLFRGPKGLKLDCNARICVSVQLKAPDGWARLQLETSGLEQPVPLRQGDALRRDVRR